MWFNEKNATKLARNSHKGMKIMNDITIETVKCSYLLTYLCSCTI